jgi:antitoxin (DNA-binding transcriptional repressor) of toxin-antitoxin stability system
MRLIASNPHALSVTEAASRGLPRLVRDAEMGEDLVVERRGRAVAAVVSMRHLDEIRRLESDLQDAVLLLARLATDTGARTPLDAVIAHFGFDRAELEAELDAETDISR